MVTPASDSSDSIRARRARLAARQARVGLLRNPNTPPRPPQRKAQLMGKWPSLRSSRRGAPETAGRAGDGLDAATLTDAELARLLKPVEPPHTPAAEDIGIADLRDAPPLPLPPDPEGDAASPPPLHSPSRAFLLVGALAFVTLTMLYAVR